MNLSSLPPVLRDRLEKHRNQVNRRWFRWFFWAWIGVTAVFIVAALTVSIVLNTAGFHAYLLRTVEKQASESLGTQVHLENFALHFSNLSIDLYGIAVDGVAPRPYPQLLQVDHASASVRVVSILHRAWYLDHLQIDRPIAQITVDEHGVSNLPVIKSSGSSSSTSVFELGIRSAILDQGEVYYNNRPSALTVDLHDVEFKSAFNSLLKQYSGTLSYSDGRFAFGTFRPIAHNLQVSFEANPNTFNLKRCTLDMGASQLNASATLQDYNNPEARGHYSLIVDGGQMASLLNTPSIPVGVIRTSGSIHYLQSNNTSPIDSVEVNGDLNSDRLRLKTSSARADISSVSGHYALTNGNLTLSDLRASLLGGQIAVNGTIKNLGGNSRGEVTANMRRVSLGNLTKEMRSSAKSLQATLSGELNGDAKAAWGQSFEDLVAHADVTIAGEASGARAAAVNSSASATAIAAGAALTGSNSIAVNSAIHASYFAHNGQLTLQNSYLRTPRTTVTLNGALGERSNLGIKVQAGDLSELESIADLFNPATANQPSKPLGLGGRAAFQGTVSGSTSVPHLKGHLSASSLKFNGSEWKTLRADLDINPSQVNVQNANIEPSSGGSLTMNASTGLSRWSFTKTSPIQIDAKALQLNIPDLIKLANQQLPVTGKLNAAISLHGSELNPAGSGNITLLNVTAYDEPVRSFNVSFSGDGQQANAELLIQLAAGSIQGKASVRPEARTYTAELSGGGIELSRLQSLKTRNINITGILGFNAKGQGSFDNPEFESSLQIPTLVTQGQTMSGISLKMSVADHFANALLSSSALNTSIQAKARIGLTGDYPADASLDTQGIPLQPLLAAYAPEQATSVTGQTEVHATLHGPLKNKEQLEAHVDIPVLKLGYGDSIQLAATSPIRADYKNGVIEIQRSSISGTNTDLHFQGSIPVNGKGPMSLVLQGAVNLQLVQLFDPDVRSSGQVRFNIDSHGASNASDIGGQIDIVDANFASADLPVGLQHGNGVLTLTKDRLNISSFEATVGGGTVTAQGGVAYRPSIQFNMGMAAKGIRILYPQGMRENLDADLRFSGTTDNALLGGSVNLSDLSFTPGFDLNSFIGQFSSGVAAPPSQGMAQNVQLNIALRSSNNVNLVSRTLSVGGSANLQVRGTAAEPVILGRVNLSDGDIILNGNRYVLNGGTIQFINPSETQPVVNFSLNTSIQQYSIDLRFEGPIDQLRTEYNSDPALPSADIIHLLAFGNTTEASAAAAGNTSTVQTGESLVASQVSSQVTSRVSRIAGISQLSISPVLAGSSSQGPPGAVITIQQRVTGNLFVNFSTNVASTQSQTIQGQYKVSPRVSVSATRDPNGGFGFDTLIKKSW